MAHEDRESKGYNSECFACGKDNPYGLHIGKVRTDHGYSYRFKVKHYWCGYPGILHGGIQAIILDEIMGDAANEQLRTVVTLDMAMKYINAGREGMELVCDGWVSSIDGRHIETRGTIKDLSTGNLISEAVAHYLLVDMDKFVAGSSQHQH